MKFNVVCISMAIGLLASCSQAAPIEVEKVVDGPVGDAQNFATQLTGDVNGDVAQLKRELLTGAGGLVGGTVSGLGLKKRADVVAGVEGLVEETVGGLKKRQDLLKGVQDVAGEAVGGLGLKKRQGADDLVGGLGVDSAVEGLAGFAGETVSGLGLGKRQAEPGPADGDAGLVGNLLGKRGNEGGVVNGLVSTVGLNSVLGDSPELLGGLKKRGAVDGLTAPVTGTVSGLKVGETVGQVADVSKLVAPVSGVTSAVGVKRDAKPEDDNEENAGKDDKTDKDAKKDKKADKDANEAKKADKDADNEGEPAANAETGSTDDASKD